VATPLASWLIASIDRVTAPSLDTPAPACTHAFTLAAHLTGHSSGGVRFFGEPPRLTPQEKWEETQEKEERETGVEGMEAVMAGELLLEGTGGWGEGKGHAGRR